MLIYYNAITMKQGLCSIFCAGTAIIHHNPVLFQKAWKSGLRTELLSCVDVLCLSPGGTSGVSSLLTVSSSTPRSKVLEGQPDCDCWFITEFLLTWTALCSISRGTLGMRMKGDQNMPPQNMPLQQKDYFELKTISNKCKKSSLPYPYLPISKSSTSLPLFCRKENNPY